MLSTLLYVYVLIFPQRMIQSRVYHYCMCRRVCCAHDGKHWRLNDTEDAFARGRESLNPGEAINNATKVTGSMHAQHKKNTRAEYAKSSTKPLTCTAASTETRVPILICLKMDRNTASCDMNSTAIRCGGSVSAPPSPSALSSTFFLRPALRSFLPEECGGTAGTKMPCCESASESSSSSQSHTRTCRRSAREVDLELSKLVVSYSDWKNSECETDGSRHGALKHYPDTGKKP